jgi:hypothetical protein
VSEGCRFGRRQAKATYLEHEVRMFTTGAAEVDSCGLVGHIRRRAAFAGRQPRPRAV